MKRKNTKKALSGSVLALVLCFVMLIGTTFAWFTSSDSTAVNSIEAGTLKVGLEMWDGSNWVDASGKTLDFAKAEGHDKEAVLWEPGATYTLPKVRVVNNGNLALKYKVVFTAVKGDSKLAEVLNVSVATKDKDGNEETKSGFTLKDVLGADYDTYMTGNLTAGQAEEITISMTMDTKAGNAYQGLKIDGIAVTVVAAQDTVEYDSTRNDYDAQAIYDTLVTASPVVNDGGVLGLGGADKTKSNVVYSIPKDNYNANLFSQSFGANTTIDGNGSSFPNFELNAGYVADESSTLVVRNLNVTGNLTIQVGKGNIVLQNCTAGHIEILGVTDGKSVSVENCTVTGVASPDGNAKYGIYMTRSSSSTTAANVSILNSSISNCTSHAISVNAQGATNFTISGNTFSNYGTKSDHAAFKIWGDTVLAPSGSDTVNDAAKALAASIGKSNTFTNVEGRVLADFYGACVNFSS